MAKLASDNPSARLPQNQPSHLPKLPKNAGFIGEIEAFLPLKETIF